MIRHLALAFLLCAFGTAAASPKVALTAIDGDAAGDVREAVASALDGKDLTLIGEKEVNRAFDKLGEVSVLSEKAAKKLAKELEADAVVHGKLGKQNGKKKLSFELFVNGKKVKGFTVQFKSAKSAKFQSMLRDKMVEKLEGAGGEPATDEENAPKAKKGKSAPVEDEEDPLAGKGGKAAKGKKGKQVAAVEEEETPKGKKGKKKTKAEMIADAQAMESDEESPKKKDKKKPVEDEAAAPEEKQVSKAEAKPAEDEEGTEKPKKKVAAAEDGEEAAAEVKMTAKPGRGGADHTANRAAARLDVGVSVLARQLSFNSNLDANQAPKPFKPSPVPGARIDADIYPLAFTNPNSIAAGLGLGFEYDKTLSMNLQTQAEPGVKIPVNSLHYMVSGKFRIAIGHTETSPTVALGFGYGRRRFIADRTKLAMSGDLDLPDTDYKFLSPSLEARIPLGRLVALIVGGDGMLVRDAGPISKANSYGKAKIVGFDAFGGFDIVLGSRFAVRLIGEFQQIGYSFVGAGGDLANNRDDDPTDRDVGGAADRSFGGAATLAVHY